MPTPHTTIRLLALAAAVAALAFPTPAAAGQYTVVSCDAAPNASAAAWTHHGGSVNAYALCPSATGPGVVNTRGISSRVTGPAGTTFLGGTYSRWGFYAPHGTNISHLVWAGRGARNTPSWAVELTAQGGAAHARLVGVPAQPGASSYEAGFEYPTPVTLHPPAGTTSITQNTQCGAASCGTGATMHTYYAAVTLNDVAPPAVSMAGVANGEWVRGDRTISFNAVDNVGIKAAHLIVSGQHRATIPYGCDFTRPVPCSNRTGGFDLRSRELGDGTHRVEIAVVDASNTTVSTARTIHVDNTPPAHVTPTVEGGEGWRARNGYNVRWQLPTDDGSPIVGGTWQLCHTPDGGCATHQLDGPAAALANVSAASDGTHELRIVMRDQAGNVASLPDARPATLRLDREPPTAAIDPLDPNVPLRAAAATTDRHSGVAAGQLEFRRVGAATWQELPTTLTQGRLVGHIDDARLDDGRYELRARVRDHAGNERSTGIEANGAQATRQIPLRIRTRIQAGRTVTRKVRRKIGKGQKRRTVVRRVKRFQTRFRVRRGRHTTITGTLANPDGQPLHDVPIEVASRTAIPGAAYVPVALVRTNRDGRFTYRLRGTTTRTLRLTYAGSSRIRPSTAEVAAIVPGTSTFRLTPRRILNGETVTFKGRVRGPVPDGGKLVELRKWTGTRWAPFRVVRSDEHGRWSHTEQVVSVAGVMTYRLRAQLPAEAGWPFAPGRTPPRKLRVRGL